MNTAMSTKRTFVAPTPTPRHEAATGTGTAVLGLIGGAILMAIAIMVDNNLLAGAGFVAFATGFLYLNGMFWAKFYDSDEPGISNTRSRINRYY